MIVLVQWTLATPTDWVPLDLRPTGAQSRLWRNAPKKPVPASSSAIDNTGGWVFSAMVQGIDLYGFDHLAVEPMENGGIKASGWVDDTSDPTFTYRWGEVWEFHPGSVDRTMDVPGGQLRHQGPDQRKTVYAEDLTDMAQHVPSECGGLPVPLRSWSEWPSPAEATIRHGIWVKDQALWQRHFDVRRKPSWREWVT